MNKKVVAIALTCAMLLTCVVGGTLAWLTDKTNTVTNTFTIGDINIELTEEGAENGTQNYDFVPGDTLDKEPKVTVEANSEPCYVFVKVIEKNNSCTVDGKTVDSLIDWNIDNAVWTKYEVDGVPANTYFYYRVIDEKLAADTDLNVLLNKTVKMDEEIIKEMVPIINAEATKPALEFEAAAVQKEHTADVHVAWSRLPDGFKS